MVDGIEAGDLNWFINGKGLEAKGDENGFKEDRLLRDNGEENAETDVGEDDDDNDDLGAGDETAFAPEVDLRFKTSVFIGMHIVGTSATIDISSHHQNSWQSKKTRTQHL